MFRERSRRKERLQCSNRLPRLCSDRSLASVLNRPPCAREIVASVVVSTFLVVHLQLAIKVSRMTQISWNRREFKGDCSA